MPARRTLARANLVRVVRWLDANGTATPGWQPRRAIRGGLDALVRDAFGHWVRTYAESAIAPRYDAGRLRAGSTSTTRMRHVPRSRRSRQASRAGSTSGSTSGRSSWPRCTPHAWGSLPVAGPMETVANPALRRLLRARRAEPGRRHRAGGGRCAAS